jgi:two-component system NtrC family sensor kinase
MKRIAEWFRNFVQQFKQDSEIEESPRRYKVLRRNMIALMILVTVLPLVLMALINYYQYRSALRSEVENPIRVLLNKTKHSYELFLTERLSAVSFIAHAYTFSELADHDTLNRIFLVMKNEFGGFVDLGLIDSSGRQISYAGPYQLEGKDYAGQAWFQEVSVRGIHISDVFMGYRRFPHFVIAVQHVTSDGYSYILRATIDTEKFNSIILSMGLTASTDAFLLNRSGVFQTPSKVYGHVLETWSMPLPPVSYEPSVLEVRDSHGQDVILGYTDFVTPNFVLVLVKPRGEVFQTWITLKSELFFVFLASIIIIFMVVAWLTNLLVKRIEESDLKRKAAYHEMEYTNKLASIGRLAAGVAHEINNPMAIINEKAGLMKDLIGYAPNFPDREKFLQQIDSILRSVDRSRSITHRLLGFARRMDVEVEVMDLNELVRDVISFLEKEALYRNIEMRLQLADGLSKIASDRGQLQQVFLNILNNAFAAVEDGGRVVITSWEVDMDTVAVSIGDNGVGMSEEVRSHIFEPFFSTKKGSGTGLGLSITYGIVQKLGGQIDVQTRQGEGTTLKVYLPKKAPKQTEA